MKNSDYRLHLVWIGYKVVSLRTTKLWESASVHEQLSLCVFIFVFRHVGRSKGCKGRKVSTVIPGIETFSCLKSIANKRRHIAHSMHACSLWFLLALKTNVASQNVLFLSATKDESRAGSQPNDQYNMSPRWRIITASKVEKSKEENMMSLIIGCLPYSWQIKQHLFSKEKRHSCVTAKRLDRSKP